MIQEQSTLSKSSKKKQKSQPLIATEQIKIKFAINESLLHIFQSRHTLKKYIQSISPPYINIRSIQMIETPWHNLKWMETNFIFKSQYIKTKHKIMTYALATKSITLIITNIISFDSDGNIIKKPSPNKIITLENTGRILEEKSPTHAF